MNIPEENPVFFGKIIARIANANVNGNIIQTWNIWFIV